MKLSEISINVDDEKFNQIMRSLSQEGLHDVFDWISAGPEKLHQTPNLGRKTIQLINEAIDVVCIDSIPMSDKERALLKLIPTKWLRPIILEEVRQWFSKRRRAIAARESFSQEGGHMMLRLEVLDPESLEEPFQSFVKMYLATDETLIDN